MTPEESESQSHHSKGSPKSAGLQLFIVLWNVAVLLGIKADNTHAAPMNTLKLCSERASRAQCPGPTFVLGK